MSVDHLTELLAAHADALNARGAANADALASYAEQPAELASLMDAASRVKRTLRPVSPAPAFRARLHDSLTIAAHHQHAHRMLVDGDIEPTMLPRPLHGSWGWLIGAAALGSAAGLVAVVLRSRTQSQKPSAQPQLQQ